MVTKKIYIFCDFVNIIKYVIPSKYIIITNKFDVNESVTEPVTTA